MLGVRIGSCTRSDQAQTRKPRQVDQQHTHMPGRKPGLAAPVRKWLKDARLHFGGDSGAEHNAATRSGQARAKQWPWSHNYHDGDETRDRSESTGGGVGSAPAKARATHDHSQRLAAPSARLVLARVRPSSPGSQGWPLASAQRLFGRAMISAQGLGAGVLHTTPPGAQTGRAAATTSWTARGAHVHQFILDLAPRKIR